MTKIRLTVASLGLVVVAACSPGANGDGQAEATAPAVAETPTADSAAGFDWPASLNVLGEGYPASGDACRRLGESATVVDYLDHTGMLVGCPGDRSSAPARALLDAGATVLGEVDGVTLLSIASESAAEAPSGDGSGASRRSISGSVTGNETGSHTFTARQGQTLNVRLSGQGTIYFNVIPPGGGPADAIFVGSREADSDFWAGVAPATGEYSLLVYLMGNDGDTGATRTYDIEVIAE